MRSIPQVHEEPVRYPRVHQHLSLIPFDYPFFDGTYVVPPPDPAPVKCSRRRRGGCAVLVARAGVCGPARRRRLRGLCGHAVSCLRGGAGPRCRRRTRGGVCGHVVFARGCVAACSAASSFLAPAVSVPSSLVRGRWVLCMKGGLGGEK